MAFSSVFLTCSWLTTSAKDCGRYFLAITWYMGWVSGCRADNYARPRVIRGTRTAPLPLLPSGPGGVCGRPLHEARDLTSLYRNMAPGDCPGCPKPRFLRRLVGALWARVCPRLSLRVPRPAFGRVGGALWARVCPRLSLFARLISYCYEICSNPPGLCRGP